MATTPPRNWAGTGDVAGMRWNGMDAFLAQPRHGRHGAIAVLVEEGTKQRTVRLQRVPVLAGMDAAGNVKNVEAVVGGSLYVCHHTVADGQKRAAVKVTPESFRCRLQRSFIYRRVRLAGYQCTTPELSIVTGDGPCAPDQPVSPFHHYVGIGADEGKVPGTQPCQQVAIALRRLHLVIVGAGADNCVRFEFLDQFDIEPVIQVQVAIRADMKYTAWTFRYQVARHVPGTHEPVESAVWHAYCAHLIDDIRPSARRIGDQNHRHPRLARSFQRIGCGRKVCLPIVDDAPYVAEQGVIAR